MIINNNKTTQKEIKCLDINRNKETDPTNLNRTLNKK